MIEEFTGKVVVIDLRSPYVCLGSLYRVDDRFLEVHNADFHDLRDTKTSRENYIAASRTTGIKRNRRRVLVVRDEVIAVTLLDDLVDE